MSAVFANSLAGYGYREQEGGWGEATLGTLNTLGTAYSASSGRPLLPRAPSTKL